MTRAGGARRVTAPTRREPKRAHAIGTGRAKVILCGEHSVVHGTRAIAVGLDEGARAVAEPGATPRLRVPAWDVDVDLGRGDDDSDVGRAFGALWSVLGPPTTGGATLTLEVNVPAGAGLGGSAASGVAIADAIRALDRGRTPTDIGRITAAAQAWESVFHGESSGLDVEVAARGGARLYRRGRGSYALDVGPRVSIVVADTGVRASTREQVARVREHLDRDPTTTRRRFAAIDALVEATARALATGDVAAVGAHLDTNHEQLAALDVSAPSLESLVAAARDAGALGAKLTGSGGGGCVVAVAPTPAHAEAIASELVSRGAARSAFAVEVSS